jgi:cytochrome c biogenesis protein CcmG/thiol:disulfide interchange protein DsbE
LTLKRTARSAILLALAIGVLYAAPPKSDPLLNKTAPEFVRIDFAGRPVDLAGLRGRVVLLNFWATWCAPCRVEIPRFIGWQAKYAADGLQIIGVSMDDDSAPVASLVRKRGVNYPVVMGDAEIGLLYGGVLGLPVTYLIDRQGIVRARYKGEADLGAMKAAIQKLLTNPCFFDSQRYC